MTGEDAKAILEFPDDVERDGRRRGEASAVDEDAVDAPEATGLLADLNDAPEVTAADSSEPEIGPVDRSGAVSGQAVDHDFPEAPTYRATGTGEQ